MELLFVGDGFIEDVVEEGLKFGFIAETKFFDEEVEHFEDDLTDIA